MPWWAIIALLAETRPLPCPSALRASAPATPVLDLVGAIRLDPEFRMEDVLRALDSMTAPELEELAQLLDQHEAADGEQRPKHEDPLGGLAARRTRTSTLSVTSTGVTTAPGSCAAP